MPSSYANMSIEQLRLCAKEGDTEARFLLGVRLLSVRGGAMEGVEHLKEAAKQRHLQACERLGSVYLYGEGGVPQDKKQAMVYYEQALSLGSLTARTRLIDLYLESEDKAARGLQLLTEVADAGDKAAATRAAKLFLTGEVAGVDFEKAARYASLSDDSAVLYEAAEKLDTLGVEPELRDEMYRKLVQKDQKGAPLGISACIAIARMYMLGKGTKPDGRGAERLLRRAMELEKQQAMAEPRAELLLAELYEKGAEGLPPDHAAARRLLQTLYKNGNEVARLRYVRLCTEDGRFLDAYRAYAEARRFSEALDYVLEQWEHIPDPAAFVERALLFAEPAQKENVALRALRDELYRRALLAGWTADHVLNYALSKKDAQGALTFYEGLSPSDRSAVYENDELRASLPAPQPGEPEALSRLREKLNEVPEEIRRWEEARARLRACVNPQQRWEEAQNILSSLPSPRKGEPAALAALRRELAQVAQPQPEPPPQPETPPEPVAPPQPTPPPQPAPSPEPEQESVYPALLARFNRLPRLGMARVNYAQSVLDKLPAPKEGEEKALTRLRREMMACVESWQQEQQAADAPAAQTERTAQAEPVTQARPVAQAPQQERMQRPRERAVDVEALRTQHEKLQKDPVKALRFDIQTLRKLPSYHVNEPKELTRLRTQLLEELRARWQSFQAYFSDERPENRELIRMRARYFNEQFVVPAQPIYENRLCAEYDALCAAIERVLEAPDAQQPDWAALRRDFAPDRSKPGCLRELTALWNGLPAKDAQEAPDLTAYRSAVESEMLAVIEQMQAQLDGCNSPDARRKCAAQLLAHLDFAIPAGLAQTIAPALDALLENLKRARTEPEWKAENEQEWKRRLEAFNRLNDEEKKRAFAHSAMGRLPEKREGEPVSLTILRSLLAPYQADGPFLSGQHTPESQQKETDGWQQVSPEHQNVPRKKRGGFARVLLGLLLVAALAALGFTVWMGVENVLARRGESSKATGVPVETDSSTSESTSLTQLTPVEAPEQYYIDRWTNPVYTGNFSLLYGGEVIETGGIGWFVPSSSMESYTGAEGEVRAVYDLEGKYSTLRFSLSADQKWTDGTDAGLFRLTVLCDGEEVFDSDWCGPNDSVDDIKIDLRGCQELTFVLRECRGPSGTLNIVMGDLALE